MSERDGAVHVRVVEVASGVAGERIFIGAGGLRVEIRVEDEFSALGRAPAALRHDVREVPRAIRVLCSVGIDVLLRHVALLDEPLKDFVAAPVQAAGRARGGRPLVGRDHHVAAVGVEAELDGVILGALPLPNDVAGCGDGAANGRRSALRDRPDGRRVANVMRIADLVEERFVADLHVAAERPRADAEIVVQPRPLRPAVVECAQRAEHEERCPRGDRLLDSQARVAARMFKKPHAADGALGAGARAGHRRADGHQPLRPVAARRELDQPRVSRPRALLDERIEAAGKKVNEAHGGPGRAVEHHLHGVFWREVVIEQRHAVAPAQPTAERDLIHRQDVFAAGVRRNVCSARAAHRRRRNCFRLACLPLRRRRLDVHEELRPRAVRIGNPFVVHLHHARVRVESRQTEVVLDVRGHVEPLGHRIHRVVGDADRDADDPPAVRVLGGLGRVSRGEVVAEIAAAAVRRHGQLVARVHSVERPVGVSHDLLVVDLDVTLLGEAGGVRDRNNERVGQQRDGRRGRRKLLDLERRDERVLDSLAEPGAAAMHPVEGHLPRARVLVDERAGAVAINALRAGGGADLCVADGAAAVAFLPQVIGDARDPFLAGQRRAGLCLRRGAARTICADEPTVEHQRHPANLHPAPERLDPVPGARGELRRRHGGADFGGAVLARLIGDAEEERPVGLVCEQDAVRVEVGGAGDVRKAAIKERVVRVVGEAPAGLDPDHQPPERAIDGEQVARAERAESVGSANPQPLVAVEEKLVAQRRSEDGWDKRNAG